MGAGGAPGQEPSALLSAAGLLKCGQWDGVWTLFTAWMPDLEIDGKGQPTSDSICLAVALGLVSQPALASVGRVRIDVTGEQPAVSAGNSPQASASLIEFLADENCQSGMWSCLPSPWMRLEIELAVADLPKPHFSLRGAEQSRAVVGPRPAQTPGSPIPPV
jgi:hypothetical protein